MDTIDLLLLRYLEQNCRDSFTSIGTKTQIQPQTLYQRYYRLASSGDYIFTIALSPRLIAQSGKNFLEFVVQISQQISAELQQFITEFESDIVLATLSKTEIRIIVVFRSFERVEEIKSRLGALGSDPVIRDIKLLVGHRAVRLAHLYELPDYPEN